MRIFLVILMMFIFSESFASDIPCPEISNKVLQTLNIATSTDNPLPATIISSGKSPNGTDYLRFENAENKLIVDLAKKQNGWHWISIINGSSRIKSSQVGNLSQDTNVSSTSVTFQDCEASTFISNQVRSSDNRIIQISAGAQFCRNLNDGKTPEIVSNEFGSYLEFSDKSGNISTEHEDEVRLKCKELEFLL